MHPTYQRIKDNLKCLPPKDFDLCVEFLKKRDFEKLQEIVESCLIMKKRDDYKDTHKEKWINVNREKLEQLTLDVREYISYLDFPDYFNNYDDYY